MKIRQLILLNLGSSKIPMFNLLERDNEEVCENTEKRNISQYFYVIVLGCLNIFSICLTKLNMKMYYLLQSTGISKCLFCILIFTDNDAFHDKNFKLQPRKYDRTQFLYQYLQ